MYIKLDYTVKNLIDFTYELLEINKIKDAYIRPLVYLGADMSLKTSKEVHLMICAWEQFKYLGEKKLRLMTFVKTTDQILDPVLLKQRLPVIILIQFWQQQKLLIMDLMKHYFWI